MKNDIISQLEKLLTNEITAQQKDQDSLQAMPLETALSIGKIMGPAQLVEGPHGNSMWLEAKGYYCYFRAGDVVDLNVKRGERSRRAVNDVTIKEISYPSPGSILFEITKKQTFRPIKGMEYFLYPSSTVEILDSLRSRYSGLAEPAPTTTDRLVLPADPSNIAQMNDSQKDAFRFILENNFSGCLQGPPGTGKTELLRAFVETAVTGNLIVGLAAYTHTAVDNALSRIVDVNRNTNFQRVGDPLRIKSELYKGLSLDGHTVRSFSSLRKPAQLYAATTHAWVLNSHAPVVDIMILDEAGQIPSFMQPLILCRAPRFIVLGDHKQLPPVYVGRHESSPSKDFFSLEMQKQSYVPMLTLQYRMNQEIQSWSSKKYYDNRLQPHPANADRDILRSAGTSVIEIGDREVQLLRSDPAQAQSEAKVVAELAELLVRRAGLDLKDMGIISPYRKQVGAVRQALVELFEGDVLTNLMVDTVERFQGQEKEVIMFTFGPDAAELNSEENETFLSDPHRLNVACTRAKSRLYTFAPDSLVTALNSASSADELCEFLQWCGGKKV